MNSRSGFDTGDDDAVALLNHRWRRLIIYLPIS